MKMNVSRFKMIKSVNSHGLFFFLLITKHLLEGTEE
jgi:hypothetical protein